MLANESTSVDLVMGDVYLNNIYLYKDTTSLFTHLFPFDELDLCKIDLNLLFLLCGLWLVCFKRSSIFI